VASVIPLRGGGNLIVAREGFSRFFSGPFTPGPQYVPLLGLHLGESCSTLDVQPETKLTGIAAYCFGEDEGGIEASRTRLK